jgi:hypothetical protein
MDNPGANETPTISADMEQALGQLRELWNCELTVDAILTIGSGSPLVSVFRAGPGFDDKRLIKLGSIRDVNGWISAENNCPPRFRKQHITNLETHTQSSKNPAQWILALRIAGGDLSLIRPLEDLKPYDGRAFFASCKTIVASLIGEWNPPPFEGGLHNIWPAEFLTNIFDSALVTRGKPLHEWLGSVPVGPSSRLIKRPGWEGLLPNPLALASALAADYSGKIGEMRALYGRSHGDLHLRNILLQAEPVKAADFKLVDLGSFSPNSPLARDPMHLLLSIGLGWLNQGVAPGSDISRSLASMIVNPLSYPAKDQIYQSCHTIHEAGYAWAAQRGLGHEWRQQSLLSLVACGLRYASREITSPYDANDMRGWFFDLAALAAREYLKTMRIWDCYLGESRRSSILPRSQDGDVIRDIQELPPRARQDSPRMSRHSAEVPSDEGPGAQVLQFRDQARRRGREPDVAIGEYGSTQSSWDDLIHELQRVSFDSDDWHSLAVRSDSLLRQIRMKRPPILPHGEKIEGYLQQVDDTLTRALSATINNQSRVRVACRHASMLRGWVLDLLENSET